MAAKSLQATKQRMAIPYLCWAVLFIVIPIVLVIYYSFCKEQNGELVFSWANYQEALKPLYISVMGRSIQLALISTLICLLAGYPVAYIMASREYSSKGFLLFLFLVPMWMNFLLRTYSWLTILENNGLINSLLAFLGIPKLNMLYTQGAVALGMVYNFLPFMILPIYTVLKKMDQSLIEAAQDLGADGKTVFLRLVFPLSIPGIISGITMVFMPAVTTFIISDLLGGAQYMLIGNLIEHQFLIANDWYFGSAVSVILMALILISAGIFSMVDKGGEEGALF